MPSALLGVTLSSKELTGGDNPNASLAAEALKTVPVARGCWEGLGVFGLEKIRKQK